MGEHFYGETVFAGELNEVIVILYNTHTHVKTQHTRKPIFEAEKLDFFEKTRRLPGNILFWGRNFCSITIGLSHTTCAPRARERAPNFNARAPVTKHHLYF